MKEQSLNAAIVLCGVVIPSAAILGSHLIGSGVSSAFASTPDTTDQTVVPIPKADLKREVAGWDGHSPLISPFWVEPELNIINDTSNVSEPIRVDSRPRPVAIPPVVVTSILPSPRNPLAVIDGKPCRVGDTLASGWTVLSINGEDNTVSLVHTSGAKLRTGLKKNP